MISLRDFTSKIIFPVVSLALLTLAFAAGDIAAATPAKETGSITGKIANAVTGQFLNKARVTVLGTNQVVFTDNFGEFLLVGIPAGPVQLEAFYTDLDAARVAVTVPAGGTVKQSFELTSLARYGKDFEAVRLNAFVVSADKETDAQAIATNEQRFSANIKNVMSTDALGDVLGNSVGEFLKFIPGVTVEYDNADISSASVRGMGSDKTAITTNGAPGSSAWVGASRTVDLRSMSLGDISRIEVAKVPTPANPADALGGSINFVSKSAFEKPRRELIVGLSFLGSSNALTLKKTPTNYGDEHTYKVFPGINIDFTWPITNRFGVVLTAMSNDVYSESTSRTTTWAGTGAGTNASSASLSNPYLQQYQIDGGYRTLTRNSVSFKADWKVSDHGVLSLSSTLNRSNTRIGNVRLTFNTGNNGTPTVAGGTPLTWNSTSTQGATGRGSFTNSGNSQKIPVATDTHSLNYRYDNGHWRVEAGLSRSETDIERIYQAAGFFWQTLATNASPVRINLSTGGGDNVITAVDAYNNSNRPVDWGRLENYRGTNGITGELKNFSRSDNGFVNVRRTLGMFSFPTAVQVGASERQKIFDSTGTVQTRWDFAGPDGVSGATASMVPYSTQVFHGDFHGDPVFAGTQWLAPTRAWQAYQDNPLLYKQTPLTLYQGENGRLNSSEYFKETVDAAYVQGEATLLNNRLKVLGGVRFEKTKDFGAGRLTDADAVWQRDANGNYVRNANGARIRKPEAGANNSLDQLLLTSTERGAINRRTYDGYYPSLHITHDVSENFLVRLAYAKSYGRPNLNDIVPRTVATGLDLDPNSPSPPGGRGNLTIRNGALLPWTADNYDLSFEYYAKKGGMVSAGFFLKDIADFFGTESRLATQADLDALDLDGSFLDWNVRTSFNSGAARIKGVEFNLRYPLRALGRIGEYFTIFANATKLQLEGNRGADFSSFIPKSANWGVTFSQKKFTLTARWNYRGLDKRSPQAAYGTDGYEYYAPRTTLDASASYLLTKRFTLTASVSNLLNEPLVSQRYGSETPAYARQYFRREFGAQLAVGIRGRF